MDGGGSRSAAPPPSQPSPWTSFQHFNLWPKFSIGNSGSSREPAKETSQDKGPQPITGRRSRAGFSDSFTDLDVGSLVVDDHHDEDKGDNKAQQQPQVQANNKQSSQQQPEGGEVVKPEPSPKTAALEDKPAAAGSLEPVAVPQQQQPTGTGSPTKASPAASAAAGTPPPPSKASPSAAAAGDQPPPLLPSSASTSASDPLSIVPLVWRDFFKAFKKGPAPLIKKQNIPSLRKAVPKLTRRKSKRIRDGMVPPLSSPLDAELCYLKPSWKNFALWELLAATENFSRDNLIGEGGYAEVYKGQLSDGQFVAIKRLVRGSSPEEMTMDFLSELGIICHVDHPHIAKLIGYGVEGGMHLVLQLSINGSVSSLLYGPREKLSWPIRYKIAAGTAEGLLYLHEGCQRRIIHKDIKAANILLTEDFEPQISDFGLARWLPENWTHHTVSKIEGTFGYLPPEFFMHGIVDEKTDVFAYGVLLLELITGRQAIDSSQHSLVMWAKPLLMQNKITDLVDPVLGDSYNLEQMERLVCLAAMCVEQASVQRPQMSQAVEILRGDESTLEEVKRRQKSKLQRTYSEELFDADEYNSTRYLSDLNIHLEDLLEPDDNDDDTDNNNTNTNTNTTTNHNNNDDEDEEEEAYVEAPEEVKPPSEDGEEKSPNHDDDDDDDAVKSAKDEEEKSVDGDEGKSNEGS